MCLLYLFIRMHFCVLVFTCSLFESLYFYRLFLLGTVCPKPNINFHIRISIPISIPINKNKSKIKSYTETSVGNEGGVFPWYFVVQEISLSVAIRSQNPEKESA